MTPNRWNRAEELFGRGMDASAAERKALLRGVDSDVADAVAKLWKQHDQAGSFLREPAVSLEPVRSFQTGQRIGGRFVILEFIGAGGMGEVYKAEDERLGRLVAIKALNTRFADRSEFRQRLEKEARSICALNHPRICALYDLCWEGPQPFLVMEFLSGQTLAERLACGRLPLDELLGIADGIADGLSFAHQRGLVHRDLKPANVILTENGVKLLDFGIAKQQQAVSGQDTTVTVTGERTIVGTAAYMSPEQAEGKEVGPRSDIFSFGAVLYEMATGGRAFQGDSLVSTLAAILHVEPAPVRSMVPSTPPALDRVVRGCLKKRPEDRYASALDVRKSLQRISKKSNRGVLIVAVAAIVLAAAIWAAVLRTTSSRGEAPIPRPVQLTRDKALTFDPSISPDGKLVAYISNRGQTGSYGVWVQPIGGGSATQIAGGYEFAADAVFTPDGARIVYACGSEDDPDLYEVPVKGGTPRLLAKGGAFPSISSDGKWLAYLTGSPRTRLTVMPLPGGTPEKPCPTCIVLGRAIWARDNRNLLFMGWAEESSPDVLFWLMPRTGGSPQRSTLGEVLKLPAAEAPMLIAWDRSDNIYLSYAVQSVRDIWRIPVAASGLRAAGAVTPVTSGMRAGNASLSGERLVLDTNFPQANLMRADADTDRARLIGKPVPLTLDDALNFVPAFVEDARTAVYYSTRNGKGEVIRRDMKTAQETALPIPVTARLDLTASPDGRWVAWTDGRPESIYSSSVADFHAAKLCEACGFPVGWLPDTEFFADLHAAGRAGSSNAS